MISRLNGTPRLAAALRILCACLILGTGGMAHAQQGQMTDKGQQVEEYLRGIFSSRKGVDVTAMTRKWLDIPYASLSQAEKLDIYLPEEGGGPFPVILAIHGGSFTAGDKRDFQIVPMLAATRRGYAVVSINYRLSGEARFPAQIHDVKAAIRWVRANAARYSLAADKLALWGDSAGGNLAALAGVTGGTGVLEDKAMGNPEQSSQASAVVDWYGPIDFLTMGDPRRLEEKGNKLIGKTSLEAPELYRAASPESHIRPGVPPILIQHGDADQVIALGQSVHFAARLRAALGEKVVALDVLKGADHLDERFTTPENIARVLDFLDGHLR
ncbi:MAG: alpha/beta hydrolase [Humidesulfovibrio sp.]|nr:alpha/beta hydrolase [Humidesulfovibrio sp.]